jgi:tetratricopeptide (TPR) repeat protein
MRHIILMATALSVMLASLTVMLAAPALADLASDRRECADTKLDAAARVAACTRLIDEGGAGGRELAGVYLSRGVAHDDLDKHEQAILDYDRALELDPGDPEIYRYRAHSRMYLA